MTDRSEIDYLTGEEMAQVLAVPRTRDGEDLPDFRLRCPFCGGELDSFTPDYGRGRYGSSRDGSLLSSGIDCGDCGAVWADAGWLFRAPRRDPDTPQEAP